MRIGIVTIHAADNYGAALQAYALQKFLRQSGQDAEIIDYRPPYMMNGGEFKFMCSGRDIRANAGILYIKLSNFRASVFGRQRKLAFNAFRKKYFKLTSRLYQSIKELQDNPPSCDALVCGSDQIWNPPVRHGLDPAYYLGFGNESVRRISYASSFGKRQVEPVYAKPMTELLQRLNAISVREESGVKIVEELTGRHAAWVPDPTALNDDYSEIMVAPQADDFVFAYSLRDYQTVFDVQERVSNICQTRVISPYNPQHQWMAGNGCFHMGPSEWLGYINKARFVVTNSFHGTIFSILFRKSFITVALEGKKQAYNERSFCLLERLGLSHRIFYPRQSDAELTHCVNAPVDWDNVHRRLKDWRDEGIAFLCNALGFTV